MNSTMPWANSLGTKLATLLGTASLLTMANANLLATFGTEEQVDAFVKDNPPPVQAEERSYEG